MSACPLVVLACESLHVCTVCTWRCEHAKFCVEVFYALYINFHSFIHSYTSTCTLSNTIPENLFSIHFTVLDKVSSKAETTSVDEENNGGSKGKRYSIDLSIAKIVPVKERKRNSSKFLFIFFGYQQKPRSIDISEKICETGLHTDTHMQINMYTQDQIKEHHTRLFQHLIPSVCGHRAVKS